MRRRTGLWETSIALDPDADLDPPQMYIDPIGPLPAFWPDDDVRAQQSREWRRGWDAGWHAAHSWAGTREGQPSCVQGRGVRFPLVGVAS